MATVTTRLETHRAVVAQPVRVWKFHGFTDQAWSLCVRVKEQVGRPRRPPGAAISVDSEME